MANSSAENATSDNTTTSSDDDLLNTPPTHWAIIAFLITVCLTTLLANLAIIASFILETRLREPFNYLLLNLAVADCIIGGFGMSHLIVYTYYHYWPLGYKHCTFWIYTDWLGVNLNLATMSFIGMDRLWAAALPISYHRFNSTRKSVVAIVALWIIVHAGILPGLMYDRLYNQAHYGALDCFWDPNGPIEWASPKYVVPVAEEIPAIVVILCYVFTAACLRRRSQQRSRILCVPRLVRSEAWTTMTERRFKKDQQIFGLLTLLVLSFFICWGPWFVYSALVMVDGDYYSWLAFMVFYWIAYSMSLFNPFLFNIGNPSMRQTVMSLFRCGKRENSDRVGPSSLSRGVTSQRKT